MRLASDVTVQATPDRRWEAFEARADACLPDCYRLAAAIVGPDDAADAVQDALVQAWRHVGNLREQDAFDPWLRSIVINRCRNVLRSRTRRPQVVDLDLADGRTGAGANDPSRQVEARDSLERAFAGMSVQHRAVLALRFTLDLSMRDIALSLRVPEGTARSRLNAAVTRLRAALHEEDR